MIASRTISAPDTRLDEAFGRLERALAGLRADPRALPIDFVVGPARWRLDPRSAQVRPTEGPRAPAEIHLSSEAVLALASGPGFSPAGARFVGEPEALFALARALDRVPARVERGHRRRTAPVSLGWNPRCRST